VVPYREDKEVPGVAPDLAADQQDYREPTHHQPVVVPEDRVAYSARMAALVQTALSQMEYREPHSHQALLQDFLYQEQQVLMVPTVLMVRAAVAVVAVQVTWYRMEE
jgi:hypothetical protein